MRGKNGKVFARLFQKAVGRRGKAHPRSPQTAKFLFAPKAQEREQNGSVEFFAVENPRRGFSMNMEVCTKSGKGSKEVGGNKWKTRGSDKRNKAVCQTLYFSLYQKRQEKINHLIE